MKTCRHSYPAMLLTAVLLTACAEEEKPWNLVPEVSTEEAHHITRTEASLTGSIRTQGDTQVSRVRFRYGTSPDMGGSTDCPATERQPSIRLKDLSPGTTYYFCLEAGNGYSRVASSVRQFETRPNERPSVDSLRTAGQGPVSIILQYRLADDGGAPVTATGCCYRAENGEEQRLPAETIPADQEQWITLTLRNLEMHTSYTVCAYAVNQMGETRTTPLTFRTGEAVCLYSPGTLNRLIGEDDKYRYTSLSFTGPLNGTDIRLLRDMAGADLYGNPTGGQLQHIDLTDATVTAGGVSYDLSNYTATDVIGRGMFADCSRLTRISLPSATQVIEEDAFRGCTALTSLSIPSTTKQVSVSTGCPALESVSVSAANTCFCSLDGVLYDSAKTRLLWYPQGKKADELELPATLRELGDYALRGCRIRTLTLPAALSSIGKGAFAESHLEEVTLHCMAGLIPAAAFQHCARLHTVRLGAQVDCLSEYCFDGCALQHIHLSSPWPPMCSDVAFGLSARQVFEGCTLHIPAGSAYTYRMSSVWKNFAHMAEETSE